MNQALYAHMNNKRKMKKKKKRKGGLARPSGRMTLTLSSFYHFFQRKP
jgi:hypothetical protein